MSIWIRSQDKEVLCECNEIYLNVNCANYQIENEDWILGIYSTEEKELKVLDMIQDYINRNLLNTYNPKFGIFQMPQDKMRCFNEMH